MKQSENQPFVTVIVTTYNRMGLLKETIDSILGQTYKNFELIVVDNYSNYDFFSHIESFKDNRIIPFQNNNYGIIAVNRNHGIKRAKGEYIAFCDDDDLWFPQKLDEQLKHFDDDNVIGVGTELIIIGDNSVEKRQVEKKKDSLLDFRKIITDKSAPLSSLIVRNAGFLFDENESFFAVEDFDFQLNLTLKTKSNIKMLSTPLIYYRVNSLNRHSGLKQSLNSLNVIKKYKKNLSKEIEEHFYAKAFYKIGKQKLALKMSKESRKYFTQSIQKGSLNKTKMMKCILGIVITFTPSFTQAYFLRKIFN